MKKSMDKIWQVVHEVTIQYYKYGGKEETHEFRQDRGEPFSMYNIYICIYMYGGVLK